MNASAATAVAPAGGSTAHAATDPNAPGPAPALGTTLMSNLTSTAFNSSAGAAAGEAKSALSEAVIITVAIVGGVIALCLLATIIYAIVYGCGKRKQVDVTDGKNRKPKKAGVELMSPYIEFQSRQSKADSMESVPLHTQPSGVNGEVGHMG